MKKFLLVLAMLFSVITVSLAEPPDLTDGGVEPEDMITINLGPTGARGWVYHVKIDTSESRQILVTEVESGSPADGILALDDVILGADGTGANPGNFSSDARKSLAMAIADAEARDPATLKLLRWRGGTTSTVTLTLKTMGAYSATAPFSCSKSSLILQQGLQYVYDNEDAGTFSFGAMALLASGNPTYVAKAQTDVIALIPDQATMDEMMSDVREESSGWSRGYTSILLGEYYLATGDTQVLPAIEAYAVNIARNTSLFGTCGHIFADKWPDGSDNGPMGGGYGTINTPGLACFLGVLLAKECGITNPVIDPAIERTSRFFAYYSGKGTIPYGEHTPGTNGHEDNGKCGLGALAFMLQDNRVEEGDFFSKMSTASANEREKGHTGSFFNYLWAPLGAAVGGEKAAAAHFSGISWMLDLNRCWDGRFQYDCLNGQGPKNGSDYHDFHMSTAALLTYALPLRKLYITGKGHDSGRWLSSGDVTEAIAANDYDATSRSDSELIADLGNWSPKVRKLAGNELGSRSISNSELNQITALANDTGGSLQSRAGACHALGQIGDSSSAAVLAALLTGPDNYVRYMAADSMRDLSTADKLTQLGTVLSAADTTSQPLYPMVEEDPLHFAHGRLAMLLFYSGNASGPKGFLYGNRIDGLDRGLLYPAIRAIAENPVGKSRSTLKATYPNLTYDDVLALSGTIVDSVANRAPADKMFSKGVRESGIEVLQLFDIAEGVPLSMIYADDGSEVFALEALKDYAGSVLTVTPDPDVIGWCESFIAYRTRVEESQAVLDAIANDPSPTPLVPFKRIVSATVDDTTLTLPNNSTVLRVTGFDHAQGDSIYTWRKASGPSTVTFGPNNGTAAGTTTTLKLDGLSGTYQFEVTMSDSRGLTEVYETVEVVFDDGLGSDVTPPNPDPMTWASVPAPIYYDGAVIYEPFDYPAGGLDGQSGIYEIGLDGTWTAHADMLVDYANDLTYGLLPTTGGSVMPASTTKSGGTRTISSSALAANGLLDDGATLWFSVILGLQADANRTNTGLGLALAAGPFGGGSDYSEWFINGGTGIGVYFRRGEPWSASFPADIGGVTSGTFTGYQYESGEHGLTVGKITWGATEDTIELFQPGTDLALAAMPISTLITDVDQSTFDTLTFRKGNKPMLDEIRFGATYDDVLGRIGDKLTMTASTATDPSGVEYYFTCTAGGGNDSGWQDSEVYTDTGLTPGTQYTYTVKSRDFSTAQNATAISTAESALTPGGTGDTYPPTPDPATFASAPAADSDTAISMTATAGSDASGPVEYYFTCTAGGGNDSGWQTSASYTDTGLTPDTQYTYSVTMRDSLGNTGTASAPASARACYVEGDFNVDCKVDLLDLQKLAAQWLSPYDMSDFAFMSQNWLFNTTTETVLSNER
jgi:hypothetical protein